MSKEYELWKECGAEMKIEKTVVLGPHTSYEYINSRRRLLNSVSRYVFASKMIGSIYQPNTKSILELGCSDGLGAHYLAEYAKEVTAVDFDEEAVPQNQNGGVRYILDDFLGKTYGNFDAVVSFDVIEHIYSENEALYVKTAKDNLKENGVFIVGTPSLESQQYSGKHVTNAHVNVYTGEKLYDMLSEHFNNVFLFTQNDEIIHPGHLRMANYLIAVCAGKNNKE